MDSESKFGASLPLPVVVAAAPCCSPVIRSQVCQCHWHGRPSELNFELPLSTLTGKPEPEPEVPDEVLRFRVRSGARECCHLPEVITLDE